MKSANSSPSNADAAAAVGSGAFFLQNKDSVTNSIN